MILFVSRAWDAVTDPLVGYLVGRSRWTPVGKLTPWWVGGAARWTHTSPRINLHDVSLGCSIQAELTLFVSQAGALHSAHCPVLSDAVVPATRIHITGPHRAVVPRCCLPVRDPHECKSL